MFSTFYKIRKKLFKITFVIFVSVKTALKEPLQGEFFCLVGFGLVVGFFLFFFGWFFSCFILPFFFPAE